MPITEQQHAGAHLVHEAHPEISREAVTVTGFNAEAGHVLGQISASGKFTTYDPSASDGSETAVAVLYAPVDASSEDRTAVVTRRLSVVKAAALSWFGGATDAQKETGIAELADQYIIAR